jgi:hypothetical protein
MHVARCRRILNNEPLVRNRRGEADERNRRGEADERNRRGEADEALLIPAETDPDLAAAVRKYRSAWPQERDAVLARYDDARARLRDTFDVPVTSR